jgi:ABC-type amino acid transport substrate-binding protein
LIYSTLSIVPELWGILFGLTQGRIDYAMPLIAVGFAIWTVVRIARLGLGIKSIFAVILIGGLYTSLLTWLSQSPAERFHLAEYGFLSLLIYRAFRLETDRTLAVLYGLIVASVLGTGDELIQWALPNRVFELKDIWLNILSSCLGMALVIALIPGDRRATD